MGDGMEWVALAPALLIVAMSAAPALILAAIDRLLIFAALLAIGGALLNFAFYSEITTEFSGG